MVGDGQFDPPVSVGGIVPVSVGGIVPVSVGGIVPASVVGPVPVSPEGVPESVSPPPPPPPPPPPRAVQPRERVRASPRIQGDRCRTRKSSNG